MRGGRHHPWLLVALLSSLFATATATTTTAEAQSWLSDRKRAEGGGIRVGDLELHPGLGAEVGYISNVYNAEDGEELGSAVMRIAPHLFLSTLTGERSGGDEGGTPGFIRFKGGLSASLQHYFAEATPDTDFGTDVNLELTLAPERPVSFTITEYFNRSFRPFADPVSTPGPGDEPEIVDPVEAAPTTDFARYQETIGGQLNGQTSGGLLQGSLGYRFTYSWFEDEAYSSNDYLNHTVNLSGAWEFLPKTALFYDSSYLHQNYTNNDGASFDEARAQLADNDQIFSRIGINGAITSRISATLAVGYGVGFFGDGNDFEGLTLNAEGRWQPSEISEWGIGYERAFTSAYQGNFALRNQVYSRLRFFFGGAFVVANKLAVEFLDFGPDPLQSDEPRSDVRYSGTLSGEYRFVDWLAVTAELSALIDDTDFVARTEFEDRESGDDLVFLDPAEFTTFEAWLGVRAFY
jgi:hypothetical protein